MEYPKFSRTDQYEQVAIGISDGAIKDSYGNDIPVLKWRTIDGHKFFEIEKLKPQKEGQFLMQPLFMDSNRFIVDTTEITKYTTEKNSIPLTQINGSKEIFNNQNNDYICFNSEIGTVFLWEVFFLQNNIFLKLPETYGTYSARGSALTLTIKNLTKTEIIKIEVTTSKNGLLSRVDAFFVQAKPVEIPTPDLLITNLATVNTEIEYTFVNDDPDVNCFLMCSGGLIKDNKYIAPSIPGNYILSFLGRHKDGRVSKLGSKSILIYGDNKIIQEPELIVDSEIKNLPISFVFTTVSDIYPKLISDYGVIEFTDAFTGSITLKDTTPASIDKITLIYYGEDFYGSTSVLLKKYILINRT